MSIARCWTKTPGESKPIIILSEPVRLNLNCIGINSHTVPWLKDTVRAKSGCPYWNRATIIPGPASLCKMHMLQWLITANILPQVSRLEEFLSLPYGRLVTLLRKDELYVRCESEVFDAVVRWALHDEENRRRHLEPVLQAVRCHFLAPHFLQEKMRTCPIVRGHQRCCDYLSKVVQVHTMDTTGQRHAYDHALLRLTFLPQ